MTSHDDGRLRATFAAMTAQAQLARWYNGEGVYDAIAEPAAAPLDGRSAQGRLPPPATVPRPRDALKARQLAALSGMSERGALKRIVHGFHRGAPGFYRDGRRWFAERQAFEQFRMSSDCSTRAIVSP